MGGDCSVARNSRAEFAVAYVALAGETLDASWISLQRFRFDGMLLGTHAITPATHGQEPRALHPSAAIDLEGNCVVAYDQASADLGRNVLARRVTNAGVKSAVHTISASLFVSSAKASAG
jgi:hypothetical protein